MSARNEELASFPRSRSLKALRDIDESMKVDAAASLAPSTSSRERVPEHSRRSGASRGPRCAASDPLRRRCRLHPNELHCFDRPLDAEFDAAMLREFSNGTATRVAESLHSRASRGSSTRLDDWSLAATSLRKLTDARIADSSTRRSRGPARSPLEPARLLVGDNRDTQANGEILERAKPPCVFPISREASSEENPAFLADPSRGRRACGAHSPINKSRLIARVIVNYLSVSGPRQRQPARRLIIAAPLRLSFPIY